MKFRYWLFKRAFTRLDLFFMLVSLSIILQHELPLWGGVLLILGMAALSILLEVLFDPRKRP